MCAAAIGAHVLLRAPAPRAAGCRAFSRGFRAACRPAWRASGRSAVTRVVRHDHVIDEAAAKRRRRDWRTSRRYSSVRAAILSGSPMSPRKMISTAPFGPHHRDLGGRPGEVDVAAQVLRAHDVVGAAVGLAGDHRHLGHRRLGIGEEQLGAVLDDAAELLRWCPAGSPARRRRSRSGC